VNEDESLTIPAPGLLANDSSGPRVIWSENFESAVLGPPVNETSSDTTAWTESFPGWTIDDSGVPGAGTANDGVTEWAGWSFADKTFWIAVSQNQNRSDFTRGQGVVAVADPDEWDDAARPAGTYNAYMTTPAISLANVQANSLKLEFDSSFRPEGNQRAVLDVSFNDFSSFTRILDYTTQDRRNEAVSLPVNNPTGGSVKFRFGLINAGNNWWWAVDNLAVSAIPLPTAFTASVVSQPAHGSVVVNANGSFTYTPAGNYSGSDSFTYSASYLGESATAPVTVTVLPRPDVASMTVNDGAAQRSRITSLMVAFDSIVNSLPANTFALTRPSDGLTVPLNVSTSNTSGVTVATLSLGGTNLDYGSLRDGVWNLNILGANVVHTISGLAMANISIVVKRLFGDGNGDGTVDAGDFALFGAAFGFSSNAFDFEANGTIDATDFAQFGSRFGITL
jgi:hypothetical protein